MNEKRLVRSDPIKRTIAQWLRSPPSPTTNAIALPLSARLDAIYLAIAKHPSEKAETPIPAPFGLPLPPL